MTESNSTGTLLRTLERDMPQVRFDVEDVRDRARRRELRRRITAGSSGLMVTGLIVGAVLFASVDRAPTGTAAGTDGFVRVSAEDAIDDPRAVERMLRQAGIEADVVVLPISQYWEVLDGTWWALHFDGPVEMTQHEFARIYAQVGAGLQGLTEEESDHGRGIAHQRILDLPRDLPAHITLFAGHVVREGPVASEYDFSNEMSPIGAFYCLGLDPSDPTAVGEALSGLGYEVLWVHEPVESGESTFPKEPPPGTVVTWAWFRGPRTVDVRLMDTSTRADHYQQGEGTFEPQETPPWAPSCD